MTFRASLLIAADASQVQGALRATQAEMGKVTGAAREMGAAGDAAAAGVQKMTAAEVAAAAQAANLQAQVTRSAGSFNELRAALDPAYRGAVQYGQAVDVVTAAVRDGAATQAQANAVLASAESHYLQMSAAQQAAAAQLASHQAAVAQMVNAYAKIPPTFASAEASARAFEAEISRAEQGFHELRASIDPVYRSSKQYEAALETASAAVRAGTASQAEANLVMAQAERHFLGVSGGMKKVGQSSALAGSQFANLGAQFNDIGVMLAAGQSPLQLAMQQGTQIAQVIGPMGAAGAVKALGGAFVSMMNPVMLITIGSIALGATMVKWLREAWPAAVSLEDALKNVAKSVEDVRQANANLSTGALDEMVKKYGGMSQQLRDMLTTQRDLARLDAQIDLSKSQRALARTQNDAFSSGIVNADQILTPYLKDEDKARFLADVAAQAKITVDQVLLLNAAFQRAETAEGPKAQVDAYAALRKLIIEIYGGVDKLDEKQQEFVKNLIAAEGPGRIIAGLDMAGPVGRAAAQAKTLAEELIRAATAVRDLASSGDIQLEEAQLRLKYVNDPVELARQLGTKEMERTQAPIRNVADSAELVALDAQAAAAGERAAKAAEADAARQKILAGQRAGTKDSKHDLKAVADLIAAEKTQLAVLRETDPVQKEMLRNQETLTAATAAQRKEVESLVTQRIRAATADKVGDMMKAERDELALLREIDPVQKEMLRNREALVGATDAERAAPEALIAQRLGETSSIDAMTSSRDMFAGQAYDAFDGIVRGGRKATDVIDDLASAFAEASLKAAFLGEGPLAGLFGTGGGKGDGKGGIFGALATGIASAFAPTATPALVPPPSPSLPFSTSLYADGGHVRGPGTGRSDSIPAWLSDGEYVVNAEATARNRWLLEAINSNREIPRFAGGGMVSGPPSSPPSAYAPRRAEAGGGERPMIQIINQSSTPVTGTAEETTDAGGHRMTRFVLSDMVSDAMTMPGGKARRTMNQTFGLRPMAPKR